MTIMTKCEQHRVAAERLVDKVRELVYQGNVRRIIVKDQNDRIIMELPFTVGVAGAVVAPVWVALGALAALAAHYHVTVERADEPLAPETKPEVVTEPW